jgi:hypothetical protein
MAMKNLPSFECLAAHAKLYGIEHSAFDAIDYDSNKSECVAARQTLISEIRTEIRSKINDADLLPSHSSCIYEKLTGSESFLQSIFRAAAFEYLDKGTTETNSNNNSSIKNSESIKNDQNNSGPLNATIKNILYQINNSILLCKQEDEYGHEFDKVFNTTRNDSKKLTPKEEYCIKKYLIKNSLIDTHVYDIDLNSHNINTTGLNCEEMIRKSNEEIYEQLSNVYLQNPYLTNDEKIECAIDKFREADYFDLMMKITALTTLNVTPQQKSRERENFIQIFAKITSKIATC